MLSKGVREIWKRTNRTSRNTYVCIYMWYMCVQSLKLQTQWLQKEFIHWQHSTFHSKYRNMGKETWKAEWGNLTGVLREREEREWQRANTWREKLNIFQILWHSPPPQIEEINTKQDKYKEIHTWINLFFFFTIKRHIYFVIVHKRNE